MTEHHKLTGLVAANAPFSHIVDTGDIVYLSGIIATDALEAGSEACTSIATETHTCLALIELMLASVSVKMRDVTCVLVHMTDLTEFDAMNAAYAPFFPDGTAPVRTCVGVAALLDGARIEITVQAKRP